MAYEVAVKYSSKTNSRTTGKKMLTDLATKLAQHLGCNDRDVKIALLSLRTFATPGQYSLPVGVTHEDWYRSMYTPTSLLGIGFSDGLREELWCSNARVVLDEIEALPKSSQQSRI